ncbi:MAG: DUF4349 domain-containing protein [Chloroflexi bacterium]|nr:DUF4349 domain-containing protein [Chloroflexota bacterium]
MREYIQSRTVIGIILLLLLAACASSAGQPAPINQFAPRSVAAEIPAPAAGQSAPEDKRIILKTANLSIVVDDPTATLSRITVLAEEMGGWVVSSQTSRVALASGGEVQRGTITVRVPAERLDEALASIKSGVVSVNSENVAGQDVTQDYTDLTSRLTNLEAAEKQLRTIMDNAQTTQDVLTVYNELVRVRGEIETTRGRIQYYDQAAAFSAITVEVIPTAIEAPIQIAGWSPGRTAEQALAALINTLRVLADVLITVVIVGVPLALIIGLPLGLMFRALRRRARA